MKSTAATTIAIIGGGVSGSLTAVQLLRLATEHLDIHLIERSGVYGRGLAYGTGEYSALLNVPAAKMSAFSDDPKHFLRWLQASDFRDEQGETASDTTFVPRRLYGDYVCHVLQSTEQAAQTRVRLIRHNDTAVDIDGNQIYLESGEVVEADKVVLSFGNFPPRDLPTSDSAHCINNPWSAQALDAIAPDDTVLIVGTGLTMVDTVLALQARGHRGGVTAVSKHGLLSQAHYFSGGAAKPLEIDSLPNTARELVRAVRQQVNAGQTDWRVTFDSLRAITAALWQRLPSDEKRRLLRHVQPYWEVHRHRMPPQAAAVIQQLIEAGQLVIRKGYVKDIQTGHYGFSVHIDGEQGVEIASAQQIVNCTGPNTNYRTMNEPLLVNLFKQGLASPDCLGLGLDVEPNGALRDRSGYASTDLYAIGPMLKGILWETTAVPEIRQQAVRLAEILLSTIRVGNFLPVETPVQIG